jgi:hypothetical protein
MLRRTWTVVATVVMITAIVGVILINLSNNTKTIETGVGLNSTNSTSTQPSSLDFNNKLIANLDKETDETLRYVYDRSRQNIIVGNTYEGHFTEKSDDELLVIFKLKGVPHAGGLDCSVAAIYNRKTLNIITQKTFPYDECHFDVLKDNEGRGLLIFSGSTTYQGNSSFMLQLLKPGIEWEQILPQENSIFTNDGQYKFDLLTDGIVRISEPIYKTDDRGEEPEWKTKNFLKWDPASYKMVDFVP